MELNDLKSHWKNAGGNFKSEADLLRMTKIVHHPSIKKIRTKLIIETVVLLFILLIYYDWFDGDQKPLYANVSLVVGIGLFLLNGVVGLIAITQPISGTNLKLSIQRYLRRIRRLFISSIVITLVYCTAIVIFFTSVVTFTKEKSLLLVFATVIVVQLMLVSVRTWKTRIEKLKLQIADFNLDQES